MFAKNKMLDPQALAPSLENPESATEKINYPVISNT